MTELGQDASSFYARGECRLGWPRQATGRPHVLVLALLVAGALLASGCTVGASPPATEAAPATMGPTASGEMTIYVRGGTYTSVSPARLAEMLKAKDFVLINVHVPYEAEIEATDAFIPYDQVAARVEELPTAKGARILVYCRSGRMSAEAARTLVGLGYTNLWELDGGMVAWEQAGYRLLQNPPG